MEETNIASAVASRRKKRKIKSYVLKIICIVLFLIIVVMGVWIHSLNTTITQKDEQLQQKEKAVVELQTQIDEKQQEVDNWKTKYENLYASFGYSFKSKKNVNLLTISTIRDMINLHITTRKVWNNKTRDDCATL